MPSTVEQHYAELLAEHYDWMFNVPFDSNVAEQETLLREFLSPAPTTQNLSGSLLEAAPNFSGTASAAYKFGFGKGWSGSLSTVGRYSVLVQHRIS